VLVHKIHSDFISLYVTCFDTELLQIKTDFSDVNCTRGSACHIANTNRCRTDHYTTCKIVYSPKIFYCVRICININHLTRYFVSNLYFHISQHIACRLLYSVAYYVVGIKPVRTPFVPKLNSPGIFTRRFSISDLI
jgi:hypothetical protein